jgi:hypothetical protein
MRFRKLRIAWSVMWGLAAVLLIVLWVRSYRLLDDLNIPLWNQNVISIGTVSGTFGISRGLAGDPHLEYVTLPTSEYLQSRNSNKMPPISALLGGISTAGWGFEMFIPDWFLLITFVAMGAAPWIRQRSWQFSLRTLLIATTLIAVVLGLIVWLVK